MAVARRWEAVPPPSLRVRPAGRVWRAVRPEGLELFMQQLAVEDDEEVEDWDVGGPDGLQAPFPPPCLWCGRFPFLGGVGCVFCEDDTDVSFSCDDWEAYSEPEEEEEQGPSASPATFCGFRRSFLCNSSAPTLPASHRQVPRKQLLTAEEAERNAEELIAEEERVKRKAEKKRLKKKRQKDRKRQERRNQELEARSPAQPPCGCLAASSDRAEGGNTSLLSHRPSESEGTSSQGPSENLTPQDCSTEEELEEELDLSSTFVSKARLKVSTKPPPRKEKTEKEKTARPEKAEKQEVPRPKLLKTPVEQSLVLADCGNETAKRGCYWEAVLLFTEAVKLNPREYRFFGNRSFCYEKLQCYPEALRDAQLALSLQPGWPKGLFRQGKALMGLKQYAEAARTFEELLRMEGFRSDAAAQLRQCHAHLLLNSLAACAAAAAAAAAPPGWGGQAQGTCLPLPGGSPLASGSPQGGRSPLASFTIASSKCPPVLPSATPTPAREWFAVWVGNLTPKVTQDVLLRYFQPFGPIDSIRCLPQKFCAFINYTQQEAAEAAYAALQGVDVEGRKLQLQLKHPVHATPPASKPPSSSKSSSSHHQPLKREPTDPPTAWGSPGQIANRAQGSSCSVGRLPPREAMATKLQQL